MNTTIIIISERNGEIAMERLSLRAETCYARG